MDEVELMGLRDECLLIYDDDFYPFAMHVYSFLRYNGNISTKRDRFINIYNDLVEGRNLQRYRTSFFNIFDSMKDVIDEFKLSAKLDIRGDLGKYKSIYNIIKSGVKYKKTRNNVKSDFLELRGIIDDIIKEIEDEK